MGRSKYMVGRDDGRIPALSLTQPWATYILEAGKDVENRVWPTEYRGPLWLHASKGMTFDEFCDTVSFAASVVPGYVRPPLSSVVRSAFLGLTWVVDCFHPDVPVDSKWRISGQYAWVLDLERTWALKKPLPAAGAQKLWLPTEDESHMLWDLLPNAARFVLARAGDDQ